MFNVPGATPILMLISTLAMAAPAPPSFVSPESLKPGQKAVVRTVFEGERIEEFEAEIVAVLKGGRAEGDVVLARATSERLMKLGIAQGMSGSPVYVDGRLVGALSFGWPFSREPLFGITPIGEMLDVMRQPDPVGPGTAGPGGVELSASSGLARFGPYRWDDGDDDSGEAHRFPGAADEASDAPMSLRPLPIPVACSGFEGASLDLLGRMLGSARFHLTAGGVSAATATPSAPIAPGSSIAIDLLRGDLNAVAIGTVTHVDGDRLVVFGHPFFQSGEVRLPLATAPIATIVASDQMSFKVGSRGVTIGQVMQDRRAGVSGKLGPSPALLPVAVDLKNGREKSSFHFEAVEDRSLAPTLIAVAAFNSLMESGGRGGNQTLRWKLTLAAPGRVPLVLSDIAAGESPPVEVANAIMSPLRFLLENPYQRLDLDSVRVEVEREPGRESYTLRQAELDAPVVRPGGTLTVRCEIERWRGGREMRELVLTVPRELPAGRYVLWIGGAPEFARFEAARLPGRYRPLSLDEAWARLSTMRTSDALYAVLLASAPEVTFGGRDYPELPGSVAAVLASPRRSGDVRAGSLALLEEHRVPFTGPVRGEIQLAIDVDSQWR